VSLADRIARIDARIEGRKADAESTRDAMPLLAAEVDRMRAVFGPVKVTYAKEGCTSRGTPFEERYPVRLNADEFMAYVRTGEGWERTNGS
jgi:hypothetical protein